MPEQNNKQDLNLPDLAARIQEILKIVQKKPIKRKTMIYLIMYDIEDDKVRNLIARYLIKEGCIRIQKSVYIAETPRKKYEEIAQKLKEVNELYDNHDSIILIPLSIDELRSARIIGKDVDMSFLIDPPNLLFF